MKSLIVTAHPSSLGFTHKIAYAYKDAVEKEGGEAVIIDLYDQQWKQDFLTFESVRDITPDEVGLAIRREITRADEIVFVFPMWWFGAPAIMKNFFDHNLGAGFAFEYSGGKPKGLLVGRTARIFVTADGPELLYTLTKPFFAFPFKKAILGFCGIKVQSLDIFAGRVKWRGTETEGRVLEKVADRARS